MSLRQILILNLPKILLVAAAVLCMSGIGYLFTDKILTTQLTFSTDEMLRTAESNIITRFENASFMLSVSADNTQRFINARGSTRDLLSQHLQVLLQRFSRSAEPHTPYPLLLYAYINGEIITSAIQPPSQKFEEESRPLFIETIMRHDQTVISQPHPDQKTRRFVVSIAKTLSSSEKNALALDVSLESICSYVKELYAGNKGYGILLAPDMTILTYADDKYVGTKYTAISDSHNSHAEIFTANNNDMTSQELTNTVGINVISFFRRMSNGWYLGISIPKNVYFQQIQFMNRLLTITGVLVFIITVFFIIRLSQEKLRADEKNQTKSLFLARMSHEIRTPLNSILGMVEIITQMDISSKVHEYLSIISMSGNSLLAIINDILDFAKIESGTMKVEHNKYSFVSLLNDTINSIRIPLMGKPHLDFIVHVDPTIPDNLIGDEYRVRQIFFNLLSNAVKYTNKGFIHLDVRRTSCNGDKITLAIKVKDTGIGVRKEKIASIFDDFSRADVEHSSIQGTGLGLAITKTLCGMMHGHLSVESKFQSGSRFIATLVQGFVATDPVAEVRGPLPRVILYVEKPLQIVSLLWAFKDLNLPKPHIVNNSDEFTAALNADHYDYAIISTKRDNLCIPTNEMQTRFIMMTHLGETLGMDQVENLIIPAYSVTLARLFNGEHHEPRANTFNSRHSYPSARILIVDDIPTNLLVAKELLARYKAHIDTATNGADAVEVLKKNRYDIVFMDHMMPEMDGIVTTVAIRAEGKHNPDCLNVPIIALTANAMSGQREMFLESGMNDFLAKPIEMEKLDNILKKYIAEDKRVDAAYQEAETSADSTAALMIKGVDVITGLHNAGGNATAYRDILMEFCRDAQLKIDETREALCDNHVKTYTILVHSIKGAAGVIGARDIARLASDLELASSKEDLRFLHSHTNDFLDSLSGLIEEIRHALHIQQRTDAAAWGQTDLSIFKFDAMREALVTMDVHRINNLLSEYMAMDLDDTQREMIAGLEYMITGFEYDRAVEKIDAWEHNPKRHAGLMP